MKQRKTTEQFIIDAKKVHGDKYDYSKTVYVKSNEKLIIICPTHGEFKQLPNGHTYGKKCRKCADAINSKKYSQGKDKFIKKSNLAHKNKYDYSKVSYTNNKSKVTIICPVHGDFEQISSDHLTGYGCPKCGHEFVGKNNRFNRDVFIEKAKKVHKNKFNYSKVIYIRSELKVTIICPAHGEFKQTANSHLRGSGCAKCAIFTTAEINKKNPTGYRDNCWYEKSLNSNYFDSYKVYLIKFSCNNEIFYKIGKTFRTTKLRLSSFKTKYKKEIFKEIKNDDAKKICELERELLTKNKHLRYIPKMKFDGWNECFKFSDEIIFE